ncbi:hypothetical protein MVEN_01362000 [Mycena venus]|uniref:F-box domain-containing protein n=1 Tax=Mycena venus TaxID=2733690 RepID=A0A8H6XUL0_9AGAR|nr:hypothetical protein MVEN_01362000 [Mycena venus]
MDVFDMVQDDLIIESIEERRAREIRTQQNELAPISGLPPEIFAYIFVLVVPTSIAQLHSDFSWLNITRVSGRWRNIALGCPDFWSTLIFSRPKWTPVMLARSKMASLVVRVDLKKDHANSPVPILFGTRVAVGNVGYLLPTTSTHHFPGQSGACGGRSPASKCLCCEYHQRQPWNAGTQPGVRLHLEYCAFPWDSEWYSHLTHLHLENINRAQRPTLEAFLAILVGSPNLQTLSVIHCSPTTCLRRLIVELPHLTGLNIKTDSPWACLRLLGSINIPDSATIDTTIRNGICDIDDLLLPLSPILPPPGMYDTVHFEHTSISFACSLFHSARPEWFRKLRTCAVWSLLDAIHAVKTMHNNLDFSNVTTLHLHLQGMVCLPPPPAYEYTEDVAFRSTLLFWDALGRDLPRVRTLHFHKSFPALWLEFLLTQAMLLIGVSHYRSCFSNPMLPPRAADMRKAKHARLPFRGPDGALTHSWPGLRCLALHDIDLEDPMNELPPTCADALRALLWARREGKAPIWRLMIQECTNVSPHDLAHFRLFADVEYDGKGQTTGRKTDEGDESLRSYSIEIFAKMIEFSRASRQ